MTDADAHGQTGAEMLASPRDTIQEAIREYVGDGEGIGEEVLDRHDARVRAETVEYVAQIPADTLRMCQRGGVGEKNILSPEKEAGFQLCIDNIANLANSMKVEGQ